MVNEWCKDGHENENVNGELYIIALPNPYDFAGPWIEVARFNSPKEMVDFAKKTFGADKKGKIDICNVIPEGE